jgi:PIN domain nuclease of toxin-antitoxin system
LSTFVLDASGLLALLLDEEGAVEVERMLASSAAISAANLAEALSKVAERGANPREVARDLEANGVLGGLLAVEPVTAQDAITIAEMRPATKEHGLGLGDRICLALGRRLDLPVMTADRAWVDLEEVLGVEVRAFR